VTGDYITRLAARALGTAPMVQPRPTPLFDPRPATPGEPVEADLAVEAVTPEISRRRDMAEGGPLAVPPRLVSVSPPELPYASSRTDPAPAPRSPTQRKSDAPPATSSAEPPRTEAGRPGELPVAPAAVAAESRLPPAPLISPERGLADPVAAGAKTALPAVPGSVAARVETAVATAAPAMTSGRDGDGAEPAPVIRVTIGRVELRAVVEAPKAARTPTRKSGLMSLDDYLKRGRS
jgi:hypothetical protein